MSDSVYHTVIHSIGHSSHSEAEFLALLRRHGITLLADVRSIPASRYVPRFAGRNLRQWLPQNGVSYRWLGDRLGGKPPPELLPLRAERFQDGIAELLALGTEHKVAMMCSERDPAHCHRAHLVAPGLLAGGAQVLHILPDGGIEDHASLVLRLAPKQADLFGT
ncbi:DUF488 family protein [Ferrovibrio sp.]|uniref:DUF488 domain-containing protein n=1 Tax=Ferrovibrio sp. TaxID=1917215 RepID=UPI0035B17191